MQYLVLSFAALVQLNWLKWQFQLCSYESYDGVWNALTNSPRSIKALLRPFQIV